MSKYITLWFDTVEDQREAVKQLREHGDNLRGGHLAEEYTPLGGTSIRLRVKTNANAPSVGHTRGVNVQMDVSQVHRPSVEDELEDLRAEIKRLKADR